eukprot:1153277-Pelagomonas_calceolata.AAC.3
MNMPELPNPSNKIGVDQADRGCINPWCRSILPGLHAGRRARALRQLLCALSIRHAALHPRVSQGRTESFVALCPLPLYRLHRAVLRCIERKGHTGVEPTLGCTEVERISSVCVQLLSGLHCSAPC